MTIVIDPDFSVYHMVERLHHQTITRHRRTMTVLSHEIENTTLIDGAHTRIFSGFQRLSKFLPQVPRYRRVAAKAESVWVFGVGDVTPPPIHNVTYVPLTETDQLAKEWFIVSYGRDYFSALATEELSRFGDPDEERVFRGLWTFEEPMVSLLHDWLSRIVDADMYPIKDPIKAQGYNYQRQMQLVTNTMDRLMALTTQMMAEPVVRNEVDVTLDREVQPARGS